MRRTLALAIVAAATLALRAQAPPPVEYYRLVPGFLPEAVDGNGVPQGTGFATANPWGAYTAYLLATNARGQRTWRIEDYLPNPQSHTAQGSTIYLFEGDERALLVDTAQNTADTPGQNDLKTVARYLLGHQNDGAPKPNPVDFVVANTHGHGDHTGKNSIMSDRTLYYPDLDWPRNAPANYVPIKEGGGASDHGKAVGEIALGNRTLVAIDLHEHTPGSTGYLDRENKMIATGDAIGSAYVWAQFGFITQYAQSAHHLQDVLRPFDRIDVLPAHFYQVKQGPRGKPPLNGKPLDKAYVDDQVRAADAILAGTVVSDPYRVVGRNAVIATMNTGQVCYTLANLYTGGVNSGNGNRGAYHAVAIPGSTRPASGTDARYGAIDRIQAGFYLIRDDANNSMFLLIGSTRALLIGTGSGTPGLAAFAKKLAGAVPVDVVITSNDASQVGGLNQFAGGRVYVPREAVALAGMILLGHTITVTGAGMTFDLGVDRASRPLRIEVHALAGHSSEGLTLLDVNDRILFGGDALGTQDNDAGLILNEPLATFANDLAAWRKDTDGKYDVVYTAHNYQWFTSPQYVDELQQAVAKGVAGGDAAFTDSQRMPGRRMIRSTGGADVVASVVLDPSGK